MQKFISREKLSKKVRRALDARNRRTWGPLNPVTRKPENPKAYTRQKPPRGWEHDPGAGHAE